MPVLSVKIYYTIPSSSFIEDLNDLECIIPILLSLLVMNLSYPMNAPCPNFTIYIDTNKDIGIIVLSNMKYEHEVRMP